MDTQEPLLRGATVGIGSPSSSEPRVQRIVRSKTCDDDGRIWFSRRGLVELLRALEVVPEDAAGYKHAKQEASGVRKALAMLPPGTPASYL